MTDMQVTTGLRRETSDNLAFLGIRKTEGEGGCGLVRARLVRLRLYGHLISHMSTEGTLKAYQSD